MGVGWIHSFILHHGLLVHVPEPSNRAGTLSREAYGSLLQMLQLFFRISGPYFLILPVGLFISFTFIFPTTSASNPWYLLCHGVKMEGLLELQHGLLQTPSLTRAHSVNLLCHPR